MICPILPRTRLKTMSNLGKDLLKWRRKIQRRLKEGKSPIVDFKSDSIPPDLHTQISEALQIADSKDDVKEIFDRVIDTPKKNVGWYRGEYP